MSNFTEYILYKIADYKFGNPHNRQAEDYTTEIIGEIQKRINEIHVPPFENGIYTKKELDLVVKSILSLVKEQLR